MQHEQAICMVLIGMCFFQLGVIFDNFYFSVVTAFCVDVFFYLVFEVMLSDILENREQAKLYSRASLCISNICLLLGCLF
jgi:hypothetical protein